MTDNLLPRSVSGQSSLDIAVKAAKEAGAILKDRFSRSNRIESKGKRNLVTESDLLAEQSVLSTIREAFPDHNILCEESGNADTESDYRWIVDPLDGTTNYAFGIPIFCTSVALTLRDEVMVGVVYDPLRDELFTAQRGQGAFLNDEPIRVAGSRNLQTTVIGLDLGYDDSRTRQMLSRVTGFWSPEITFRLIGSAALGLTYVACGRIDMYLHRSIYPWDIASAILLVREAGGEVTDWQGHPATVWNKSVFGRSDCQSYQHILDALAESPDD